MCAPIAIAAVAEFHRVGSQLKFLTVIVAGNSTHRAFAATQYVLCVDHNIGGIQTLQVLIYSLCYHNVHWVLLAK